VFNLASLFFLPAHSPVGFFSLGDLVLFAAGVVQSFVLTPFLIAVHRFILLRQVTGQYALAPQEPRFLRFFGWSFAVTSLALIPAALLSWLGVLGSPDWLTVILIFAILALCFFVTFRLTILFPAIAIDAHGATAANAYADSKGNVWRIFFIFLLAILPLMLLAFGLSFFGLISTSKDINSLTIAGQIFTAIIGVPAYALFVAVASRLFQALGDRLNKPS
jgi:membrane-anchored glycerophosphoryl diester phosphodiesterase (GDPDase)